MSKRNKEGDEHLRKKLGRLRFKRIVRLALANFEWIADVEEAGITLNVKKNVAMLVRKKHKTGILTMDQKGMLAAPHHTRSIEDRKKLCLIVAGLDCFSQIPPKMRARLVPHLRFMSVIAGRVLMKEGDKPMFAYFVVSGEIEMSRKIYNKITRKFESKPEAFCGPGDWIGDVELLEENVRGNTFKATTNSEILVLDDTEFKAILMPYLRKVWLEKRKAISALSYLKYMNESQIISACKFGILRQYDPLDTIYPDEKDNVLYVHFVLSGECVLLQCLHMKASCASFIYPIHITLSVTPPQTSVVNGEMNYELVDVEPEESDSDAEEDKGETFDVRELLRSTSSLDAQAQVKKKAVRRSCSSLSLSPIERNCELLNQKLKPVVEQLPPAKRSIRMSSLKAISRAKSIMPSSFFSFDFSEGDEYSDDFGYSWLSTQPTMLLSKRSRGSKESKLTQKESMLISRKLQSWLGQPVVEEAEVEPEESEIFTASTESSSDEQARKQTAQSRRSRRDTEPHATHFIDIGSMTFGGLFGVGEKCDYRVVMARTTVQCLLIPLYWLMEDNQNPGHIWQRMRFYLDRCIPSRESLYLDFIKTRKWAQFKEDCVEQFTHSTTNPTKIQDIPIIIRIVESKEHTPASKEIY
ncbi:hypothetical protein KR222_009174 [Zaprionus bogoriensis]|nr:hypothetical protein KR222_009174 [Zaprionus bogoriensis]